MANEDNSYKENTGDLQLSAIKTLKNFVIDPNGDDYHIVIPDKWLLKSGSEKNIYVNGAKTADTHYVLELIPYEVAKPLHDANMDSALVTLPSKKCQLPVGYKPSFFLDPLNTLVKIEKPLLKPEWVSVNGNGSYSSLRLVASSIVDAGLIED